MDFKQISDFYDLVQYPDKYKRFLDELKSRQEGLDKAIADVGTAAEIPRLKEQAQKALVKAKEDADKQVSDAKVQAAKILEEAQKALDKAQAEATRASINKAEAQALTAQYTEMKMETASQMRTQAKLQERLLQMEKEYSEKELELNERLHKLRSVMG
jgi:DNA repair exonuclease SbcCD ATPase subunit